MKEKLRELWEALPTILMLVQTAALIVLVVALMHGDVKITVRGEIDAAVYGDVTTTVE